MTSFSLKSMKSFMLIPHSRPVPTSLTWFFSLKIVNISPVQTTTPSLIILALDLLFISPLITLDPAIFPAFDTAKIFCISALPSTVSFTSGSKSPYKDFVTWSSAS